MYFGKEEIYLHTCSNKTRSYPTFFKLNLKAFRLKNNKIIEKVKMSFNNRGLEINQASPYPGHLLGELFVCKYHVVLRSKQKLQVNNCNMVQISVRLACLLFEATLRISRKVITFGFSRIPDS